MIDRPDHEQQQTAHMPADTNGSTWTHTAPVYSEHFNWNDAGERIAIQQVADEVRDTRILDVGVGAGRTSWLVGLLTHDYVGIDYAPAMVEAARKNCPWADIQLGDARALTFADDSFDMIFFSNAGIDSLNHDDRSRALDEFARVLRPGGRLIYSTLNRCGPFYGAHAGPTHAPGKLPTPYRAVRFAARAALRPGEHLAGFRNVHHNSAVFEDHGDWAIDTMPTHSWSLIVHYITPDAARTEVADHGFDSATVLDFDGQLLDDASLVARSPWFYVLARRHSDSGVQPA
ncbi:class I SAM-dependent methyltransferase [Flexivirga oryzae]|uniref:SAM-dependent methyltransferase n=1 Tax=Flexivirga oryzae TaxID=1794944 RepID=A0A839N3D5_9MICO|nr:class I SAM-dependent methyltransferase [Flexivirga oryzae]MBB2890156.1 SAM-dependent methyltransferase [Flexivirga oryzae]